MRWYWWLTWVYGGVLGLWIGFVVVMEAHQAWDRLTDREKSDKLATYSALCLAGLVWPIMPLVYWYFRREEKAQEVIRHVKENQ